MKAMTTQQLLSWEPTAADLQNEIGSLHWRIEDAKHNPNIPRFERPGIIRRYKRQLAETKLALKLKLEQEARGGKGR